MNECCADLENREEGAGPRGGEEPEGVTVTHCRVCECRHYEVVVDPGLLGLRGVEL
jgi:hypothetical protein